MKAFWRKFFRIMLLMSDKKDPVTIYYKARLYKEIIEGGENYDR